MTLPTSNKEQYPGIAVGRSYDFGFFRQAWQGMGIEEGIAPVLGLLGTTIAGDLAVTTGGSGLNLSIAAGRAWVKGDAAISGWPSNSQGMYHNVVPTAETLAMTTAHATLPRIDQVVLRVYDTDVDGGGQIIWDIAKVDGTATAGATLTNLTGVAALPSTAFRLAYVLTPAAFAGPYVNATHIRDERTIARKDLASAKVYRNAAYNLPNAAFTAIPFDSVEFDNNRFVRSAADYVGAADFSRHYIRETGLYEVFAQATFAANTTGVRYAKIVKNGTTDIGHNNLPMNWQAAGVGQQPTFFGKLTAGDYLELHCYQNSGAVMAMTVGVDTGLHMSIRRVA